jgi:hypothetical protein
VFGLTNLDYILFSLSTLGILGFLDEAIFHQKVGDLLNRHECFHENILHLIRSFCFSFIFIFFGLTITSGIYTFLIASLFFIDVIVGVLDILVEKKSRKNQGGLSSYEYLIHMLLSFHLGALYINLIPYLVNQSSQVNAFLIRFPESFSEGFLCLLGFITFLYSIYQSFILNLNHKKNI